MSGPASPAAPSPAGQKVAAVRGADPITLQPLPYVRARILWPALGYPQIVAPDSPATRANGTAAVHLLLLSDEAKLTPDLVARHLRFVPWSQRRTRYVAAVPVNAAAAPDPNKAFNAFPSAAIEVKAPVRGAKNDLFEEYDFARGFMRSGLANHVLEFYAAAPLNFKHLYQIAVYEWATTLIPPGMYNLFWINRNTSDQPADISDEMRILIEHFVKKRTVPVPPSEVYEFDYGYVTIQKAGPKSYTAHCEPQSPQNRTEVLHPLVMREAPSQLRIGQLADPHCSTHLHTYSLRRHQANIPQSDKENFVNWNNAFQEVCARAGATCDLLLHLGDLVDYGRGHVGLDLPLNDIDYYLYDYNWILFYSLLAGEGNYTKPACTVLGNHDWRLNPYPPLGLGTPHFSAYGLGSEDSLATLHGPGAKDWIAVSLIQHPLRVDIESVAWYLLLINPFLDYTLRFPGGYTFLFLDWARNEEVISANAGGPLEQTGLPVAQDALTPLQQRMVNWLVSQKDAAKVVAQHATVMGPLGSWPKDELCRGWLKFSVDAQPKSAFAPYPVKGFSGDDGIVRECRVVPVRGVNSPPEVDTHTPARIEPTHGGIKRNRDWLVGTLQAANASLVLSGHIHRLSALRVLRKDRPATGDFQSMPLPAGTAVCLSDSEMANPPASAQNPEIRPIFVNASSSGMPTFDRLKGGQHAQRKPGHMEIVLSSTGEVASIRPCY